MSKHTLPVGLYLEVVVREVVPFWWDWYPYRGRPEGPLFSLFAVYFHVRTQ